MGRAVLGDRVDLTRRTASLAVGDLLVIAMFVAIGELRHAGTLDDGISTFVQFGVAWVVVAVFLGVYGRDRDRATMRGLGIPVVAWGLAAVIAQGIRVLMEPGGTVAPSFVVVSVVFGGLMLLAWRAVAVRYT